MRERFMVEGKNLTKTDWAKELHVSYNTFLKMTRKTSVRATIKRLMERQTYKAKTPIFESATDKYLYEYSPSQI